MIPISFDKQILPGTFEYTLNYLIDNELDLSVFDDRYSNDDTGRPAYDPAILLKIILYAYSRGITSSGKTGKPIKSNITDNESAKMKTSHGVIQGYDGVATPKPMAHPRSRVSFSP